MMLQALAYSLPLALGIALSPVPVMLSASVLFSRQPKNAVLFLLGWAAGIFAIGFVLFLMPGFETVRSEPSRLTGWFRLALGTGLVFLAIRKWQKRPEEAAKNEEPGLLSKLDTSSPGKTLVVGFTLSAFNPKNLFLTLAGTTYIDAHASMLLEKSLALLVFALVASLSVAVPVVGYRLFPDGAARVLRVSSNWLVRNNAVVVGTLLLAFGLVIAANGLSILFSFD
jgi:hypothetical protein